MDKKQMSEQDIRSKFITPAIVKAGWDLQSQIREEVAFTDGRIIVSGKTVIRGKQKIPDYVLEYKPNLPLAVVEAKENNKPIGEGMQQALDYAESLDILFIFTSNGDGFVFHDRTTGKETKLSLDNLPSPKELWEKYKGHHKISENIEDTITA